MGFCPRKIFLEEGLTNFTHKRFQVSRILLQPQTNSRSHEFCLQTISGLINFAPRTTHFGFMKKLFFTFVSTCAS